MKTKTRKTIIISSIIILAILILSCIGITIAYLTSKRQVEGYLNFASGISIDYQNVSESASSSAVGNLLCYDEDDNLQELNLQNIMPGDVIEIANPKLIAKEGTATFALRAKLVITDLSDSSNPVVYVSPSGISKFLSTDSEPIFESGNLEFAEGWEYNSEDNFHYYVSNGSESLFDRLVEVKYVENASPIYVLEGDNANLDKITCQVIDGEPIEALPATSVKIELYIQAIQYSSISVWAGQ